MWILVVDDDPEVRRVVRRGLEREGFEVTEAADGNAALGLVEDLEVDVAVLDRQMPGLSGLELIGELRRRVPSIHIIMLTGAAAEADRVLGLVTGADDYMVKPFSARELVARVVAARRRRGTNVPTTSAPAQDRAVARDDESAQAAVVVRAGTIVSASPAAQSLLGASSASHVVGRGVFAFVGTESVAAVRSGYQQADQGTWSRPAVITLSRADGRQLRAVASFTPVLWQGERATQVSLWEHNGRATETAAAPSAGRRHGGASVGTELVAELGRAIARREFVVHYQPIVRLDDATVVGAEALVRWQHPERGLLAPNAFMDAAERSGTVVDIGAFVLDEARAQWARWRDAGHERYVSVNLSGRQLADPALPELIAATRLPEGQLWLEVTETSLVQDLEQAGDTLQRIAALGPKIAIDDFGTGWASMSYLREFPVHALKIDRSFVAGVGHSAVDTAIATSVLSLGRELGLKVFAEGIETSGQLDQLRDLGCELGQGYLFGRPTPPDQLDPERP